jgi:ubiquinone/menaquinone biosynthesis C-methylase UbiE
MHKEVRTIRKKAKWVRELEPLDEVETAPEYDELVESAFVKSDESFASEVALAIPRHFKGKIYDIGSGPGGLATKVAQKLAGREGITIVCLDLDPEMLQRAERRAASAGILPSRIIFQQANMEELEGIVEENNFGYSHDAIHEVRGENGVKNTFRGLARIVGETGGLLIQDLALPTSEEQAEEWRSRVVNKGDLTSRQERLFRNSQHAGIPLEELEAAIDETTLKEREGKLVHQCGINRLYWRYTLRSIPSRRRQFSTHRNNSRIIENVYGLSM